MTAPIPERVAERAATRYVENEAGCFISTCSTGSHGYAQIGWTESGKTQMTTAHRAAWVHYTGAQPVGMVDHQDHCDRRCVRGSHLRDISNWQNARRNRADADPRLGVCLNGHDAPIVDRKRVGKSGKVRIWRTCVECERDRNRRWRANRQR
jgi:hypothetical protein